MKSEDEETRTAGEIIIIIFLKTSIKKSLSTPCELSDFCSFDLHPWERCSSLVLMQSIRMLLSHYTETNIHNQCCIS